MPALDKCHDVVVRVLRKVGYQIAPKSLTLEVGDTQLFVDIQASHTIDNEIELILVVEVKCFANPDVQMHDLYVSIGQYLVYRNLLRERKKNFVLYLAIPVEAYKGVFQLAGMSTVSEAKINLIVFDAVNEEIVEWVNW